MEEIQSHLSMIYKKSLMVQQHLTGEQDVIKRFVFVGIEKVSKISLAFLKLYPQLLDSEDLEFSLGILARTILMDMIFVMKIKSVCQKHLNNDFEELKTAVNNFCYNVVADGTNHMIAEINSSNKLSDEEKKLHSKKLASIFPKVFDLSNDRPKLNKGIKNELNLFNIYIENKNFEEFAEIIYSLYSYYSKYDHLSHWTSRASDISFEKRKERLDSSILLIVYHTRDLLSIAYDFDVKCKTLLPYINDLQNYLNEFYINVHEKGERENK